MRACFTSRSSPRQRPVQRRAADVPCLHGTGYLTQQICELPDFRTPDMPRFTVHEWNPVLDSSDVTLEDWKRLVEDIVDKYYDYDGFVILHGTDTMAYTACALSFMLENLGPHPSASAGCTAGAPLIGRRPRRQAGCHHRLHDPLLGRLHGRATKSHRVHVVCQSLRCAGSVHLLQQRPAARQSRHKGGHVQPDRIPLTELSTDRPAGHRDPAALGICTTAATQAPARAHGARSGARTWRRPAARGPAGTDADHRRMSASCA